MYTVAVTGATGFVGAFVADYLESKGYKVFRFGRKNKTDVLYWDITSGIYKDAVRVDCVVHCAASVDDWAPYKESYAANVLGTQNVLQSFPLATQFIYISSASVYDAFCREVVIPEDRCLGGKLLNNYSRTKLLGEKEVQKSSIKSKVILRPHIIYGPDDTTIGPRIRNGIKFGRFPVVGDGGNRISFTHVENLSQAIWQAIKLSGNGMSIYNITDEEPIVFTEALRYVKDLNHLKFKEFFISKRVCIVIGYVTEFMYKVLQIKKSPLLTRYIIDQMSSDHIFDISKAKRELSYQPTRNIKTDFLV